MTKSKVQKLIRNDYGLFLGVKKGCFVVKGKSADEKCYPLFENEIGEIRLRKRIRGIEIR